MKRQILLLVVSSMAFLLTSVSGSKSDKMILKDLQVLTLKAGRMTTGRRSSPVPQLKCIGNCNSLLPNTVQCINRGWDGSSIQWECKGDFEAGLRFGDLEVICEGYDYADDPYILTGSCGLEYTVQGSKSSGAYGEQSQSYGWQDNVLKSTKPYKKSGFDFESILFLLVLAGIVYALYRTCIASNNEDPSNARSTTNNDYPPDDRQAPNMGWNVPGMGGGQGGYGGDASCGAGAGRRAAGGAGGGGFWTGMAAGGLAGYMFGNRGGNQYQRQQYGAPNTGSSFFRQPSSFGSSSSASTSSSTGFAGTRRR